MTAAGQSGGQPQSQAAPKKLEAVIYLSSDRPLHLPDFFAEFHRNWPQVSLEKTGKELHRAFFRTGRSEFALELHHAQVPHGITDAVAESTLHWPGAAAALSRHVAYIEVSGTATGKAVLTLGCDLTRAIASLLPVTDSLAVCWLRGPALNRAKTFVSTANERLSTGLYPLTLWVAARWDADAHTLSTHGMGQFDAPEILLAQQPDSAPLMVDYLFQLALSLLSSQHPIAEGDTVNGPHGRLKISRGQSVQMGRNVLILDPTR